MNLTKHDVWLAPIAMAACLLIPFTVRGEETGQKPACAVLSFEAGNGVHFGDATRLCNRFTGLLLQRQDYRTLPRYAMNKTLAARRYNRADYGSIREAALEAGRKLGTDRVFYGSAYREELRYVLECALLDVRTGEAVKTAAISSTGGIEDFVNTAPQSALAELLGPAPAVSGRVDHAEPARVAPRPVPAMPPPVPPAPRHTPATVPETAVAPRPVDPMTEPEPPMPRFERPTEQAREPRPDRIGFLPEPDAMPDRVELAWRRVRKLDTEQSGGVPADADYPHYRMRSNRYLVHVGWTFLNRYELTGILGMSDLRTHSNEGETTLYDMQPAFGLLFDARLCDVPTSGSRMTLNMSQKYLRFDVDRGDTVGSRVTGTRMAGDVDITWQEFESRLYLTMHQNSSRMRAGFSYLKVDADQTRALDDGTRHDSSYKVNDPLGFFLGFDQNVAGNMVLHLGVDLINETAFGASLSYGF